MEGKSKTAELEPLEAKPGRETEEEDKVERPQREIFGTRSVPIATKWGTPGVTARSPEKR